jgi:molybdenum cofactor cytidylyltransferase
MTQGILLAAGNGRRFDPSGLTDKLLQPLDDGRPVLWHSAFNLCSALGACIAVIRPGQDARRAILESAGCSVLVARAAEAGMGETIAAAVRETAQAQSWLIALGDMPWIPPALIRRVARAVVTPACVAAPCHDGRRGHPVAFGAGWYAALTGLKGDAGARDVLLQASIGRVEPAPAGVLRDVDVPADLSGVWVEKT